MRPMLAVKSGRAQARAMKRAAERSRADRRRERPVTIPMIVKADYVLAPIEAVLSQIELKGTVTALPDGMAIFQAGDGSWSPTAEAIKGMADFFDQWATRHSKPLDVAPLRQLAARLEYVMPVDDYTLFSVRALLPDLRRIAGGMDRNDAISLIQGTQIKAELDALETR